MNDTPQQPTLADLRRRLDYWQTYGRNEYPASQQKMVEERIDELKRQIKELEANPRSQ